MIFFKQPIQIQLKKSLFALVIRYQHVFGLTVVIQHHFVVLPSVT